MTPTRAACLLSIKKLMLLENTNESYLHTLTFPNPEPDIREAARRFHNFFYGTGAGARLGLRCVWALQRGERTRRLHFHLVSGVRWDAREMWAQLPKYGFGRYDVQPPKPADRASYVARYVGRPGHLEKGARSWGAVGFEKVKQANVEQETLELPCVVFPPRFALFAWFRLRLGDDHFARRKNFIVKKWGGTIDYKTTMNVNDLNDTQKNEVLQFAVDGQAPVTVGEYRGFTLVTRKKRDKLSGVEYDSTTVEHVVLAGTETLKVQEFLPPGADGGTVKPAALVGEKVVLRASAWTRTSYGLSIRGFIKPLTTLPLTSKKA